MTAQMSHPLIHKRSAMIALGATALSAIFMLAGCAPQNSPPEQVQAQNPSVTYKYRGDDELLQANQNAMTYCSQYHAVAQRLDIRDSSNGNKTVVFECVGSTVPTTATVAPFAANSAHPYTTDQQLLDASRNADSYCISTGAQRSVATVVTNLDGTKSVTFRCTP